MIDVLRLHSFYIFKCEIKSNKLEMKRIFVSISLLLFLPIFLMSQIENVDLQMVYKIKQEGQQNSQIQELAFWLTDYVGPRLTGSTGSNRGNEWAKKKMEELGFQNVRIEAARDFSRKLSLHPFGFLLNVLLLKKIIPLMVLLERSKFIWRINWVLSFQASLLPAR